MTDQPESATDGTEDTAPEFSLQSVYLKDSSYEAPKGPRVDDAWNPQISLDLNTAVDTVAADLREVVLTVNVTVKNGPAQAIAFLVEVKQGGVFRVRNLSEDDYRRAVASIAPNVLFPYARAVVSQLVGLGGFPHMLLPPVNFDALYARSLTEAQAKSQPQVSQKVN